MSVKVPAFNLTAFEFEKRLDGNKVWEFTKENYFLSFWCSAVYVVVIFGGKWLMEKKEKFGLSGAMALWSGMLAIFSIFGTFRMWPEIFHELKYHGFYGSVCKTAWMDYEVTSFWTALFTLSKVIELGDTVFIVLRKQPLIFLHWYHHITVLLYTWYGYIEKSASGRWFMGMNFTVHAFMYTYYAIRAMRFRVPNSCRMAITVMQLSQMVVGCFIGFYVYNAKKQGQYCNVTDKNLYYSFLMYVSYFVLFAKFFYDTYINPPVRIASKEKSPESYKSSKSKKVQ